MIEKVDLNGTHAYKNFIDDETKGKLLDWTFSNLDKFTYYMNIKERQLFRFKDYKDYPYSIVKELKDRIIELENITDWKEELSTPDFIGVNHKGGYITEHIDLFEKGYVHTRYNIILSYPDEGGDSIYNSNINKLEENMVWKCEASKFRHGSTVVRSEKPRVTLSIGFLIKEKQSIY